ncbi:MAG TPA: tetratricopeptide repeat protein, partial [Acetobacteraceae bacterium]|nr:tetratricopeptide repeat protein [Acetobacteraceae bacterium]
MRRLVFLAWAMLAGLAGCARPPASAYLSARSGFEAPQIALGRDSGGESCAAARTKDGVLIYCGAWRQPSARVTAGSRAGAAELARLAEAGSWRAGLEQRYSCAAPRAVIIFGRFPARLLLCTQRLGGWPHVALAASVGGRAWFADGVQPAYPAMERAIGILGGAIAPGAARTASVAISDQLLADRLSEAAFTSGDIREFDALMRVGNSANQAEDYPAAVTAYRAALALQQKALGAENPNIVAPMMDLALNLSDQGNYRQADRLFAEAASLAPGAADATAVPRLLHYRGLDALNQGHPRRALSLLERAGRGYASLLPPALITPHRMTGPDSVMPGSDATEILTAQTMLLSPMSQQALLGVMETLRYRAVALAGLGQSRAAGLLVRRASIIAANNGVAPPVLNARIDRIAATIDTAAGRNGEAADRLAEAGLGFAQALPGSRPVADTELLRGAVLARARRIPEALAACRRGAALLRRLRLGTSARLISPCLEALRVAAEQAPGSAHAVHAEMFGMAELAQGTTTSEEIAESAARLAADARNPRVAAAIRARQDAVMALARLYRARDDLAQGGTGKTSALTALDARIAAADARLSRTDETVEAAAPNFGQLVQESVPARSVLALLRPHEAFLDIMLAPDHAWLFLLHDKRIEVARTAIGELRMTSLVRAVRHSLEPS